MIETACLWRNGKWTYAATATAKSRWSPVEHITELCVAYFLLKLKVFFHNQLSACFPTGYTHILKTGNWKLVLPCQILSSKTFAFYWITATNQPCSMFSVATWAVPLWVHTHKHHQKPCTTLANRSAAHLQFNLLNAQHGLFQSHGFI